MAGGFSRVALLILAGAAAGSVLTCGLTWSGSSRPVSPNASAVAAQAHLPRATTLGDLLTTTPKELEKIDIAEANLLCAQGLPGAENMDIPKVLAVLDQWVDKVRFATERHLYRVKDPRYSDHYRHSEAVFRMEMLAQVLQEDCGVHYNKERVRNIDFTNSKDLFVHGMIGSDNGGTCASMPVLYTAIARRLGYPVKLVVAKGHLFCRWDGGGERWNVEGAGEGFSVFDDNHYKQWPHPISDDEIERGEYLGSLTPAEELGVFLAARGHCLEDSGRLAEARIAYARAHQLMPQSRAYYHFLKNAVLRGATNEAVTISTTSMAKGRDR